MRVIFHPLFIYLYQNLKFMKSLSFILSFAAVCCGCSGGGLLYRYDAEPASISQFKKKAAGDSSFYRISGRVESVYDVAAGRFYISDGTDFLRVYGMEDFPSSGIDAGDCVELLARPGFFKGETEAVDAVCLSVTEGPCRGFRTDCTDAPWPELPRTYKNDGCIFIHHPSSDGGRNYSVYYDTSAHLARWVAYPLCSSDLVEGERTDAYAFDPLVDYAVQASIGNKSYARGNGGAFIRGHLVPSADRSGLRENLEVFMAGNIIPENSGLNSGLWASLEDYCRKLTEKYDTLYIVAGTDSRGSSVYVKDNDGKRITVPGALFKAVLAYSREGGYEGFGVYVPNEAGNRGKFSPDMMLTIEELETKLGKNDYLYTNIFQ